MNKKWQLILLFSLTLAFVFAACSLLPAGEQISEEEKIAAGVAATLTREAFNQQVQSGQQTAEAEAAATDTPAPTEPPPPTFTFTPEPTQTPVPTITHTPEPEHVMIPVGPTGRTTFVMDLLTVGEAEKKNAVGDNYAWSLLERPYTAETMEYRDYLDIMRVDMQVKDDFVYITFVVIGDLPEDGDIRYAVELDVDHEGRGETLVMASLPPDTEWTTDGVWVMADRDGDIGGLFPLYEEEPDPEQNGYETELFYAGRGEDPDLAWVRRHPEEANQIQLAFKRVLLGQQGVLWSAWADEGMRDPGMFDFNDHFSFEQAGSPNTGNYRYPVKAVALVDSTCRMWYGFIPTGEEPGLCTVGDSSEKDEPGMGYCVANQSVYPPVCGGPCLAECPEGRSCLPCQLP